MAFTTQIGDLVIAQSDEEMTRQISRRFGSVPSTLHTLNYSEDGTKIHIDPLSDRSVLVVSSEFLTQNHNHISSCLVENCIRKATTSVEEHECSPAVLASYRDDVSNSSKTVSSINTITQSVLCCLGKSSNRAEVNTKEEVSANLLVSGSFEFQTLIAAKSIASMLASSCPKPEITTVGLGELLVNAVEHGNLEIGAKQKSKFLKQGRWLEEIEARLGKKPFCDRAVHVHFKHFGNFVEIEIEDQGAGFDFRGRLDGIGGDKAFLNGRGILIAREVFDTIEYLDSGNRVRIRINYDSQQNCAV